MKKAIIFSIITTVLLTGIVSADSPQYEIIDLGTLGGDSSVAYGLNGGGQVIGNSRIGGDMHGFLYENGVMSDLVTTEGDILRPKSINNSGQIAGYRNITGVGTHAFLYEGGTTTDLGTLGGSSSYGYAINNSGHVTGESYFDGTNVQHAFLYSNGVMTDIGTLGGYESTGYGLNDNGWVVGWSNIASTFDSPHHAFMYNGTSMIDLGTLGGIESNANDINNNGQVVGYSHITGNSATHAFLYKNSIMTDIGTLGGSSSSAIAINDNGQIVGQSVLAGDSMSDVRAFLYDENIGMLNLNDLISSDSGWLIDVAFDINNSGQIVGGGWIDGEHHAFLMTPIPEPCTLLLLGLGGLLIKRQ